MSFRDDLGNLCFYEVNLQMNSIAVPGVSEFSAFYNAQRVYGRYGIGLRLRSGQSLLLTQQQQSGLRVIDGDCNWSTLSEEQSQLHSLGRAPVFRPFDIQVYFVNEIREEDGSTLTGCGGYAPGSPAVTISSSGTAWTFAHELGHVLLGSAFTPVHSTDPNNLMYAFAKTNPITNPPTLTPEQVRAIKACRYCLIPREDFLPAFRSVQPRRSVR